MEWDGSPNLRFRNDSVGIGAPCTTRTCDLLVRSVKKGDYLGQRDTAAPVFIGLFHNWVNLKPLRAATDCQSFVSQWMSRREM